MATDRDFNDMLNEYLPYAHLKEEIVKRTYLLQNIDIDDTWDGGTLIVPFKAGAASSVSYGALTAANDVAKDTFVRGSISGYKEIWGTMLFESRDLLEHGRVSEQNLLRILPEAIDEFMNLFKNTISTNLLIGAHFAALTADGANGSITVDRPDRFEIGMKISVDDDNSAAQSGYVTAINMNTKVVTVQDARSGGAAVNLTAYTTAQNAKVYHPGAQADAFSNLKDMLLSSANGGGSTLYGQTKVTYPYLQAINVDGASVTAANILEKLFDAYLDIRKFGKGQPRVALMSYKNWGSAIKVLEGGKGSYNIVPQSAKTSVYDWDEITVGGPKGKLTLVAVQEADDDVIPLLDWRALKFHTNGFVRRERSPDGNEFFVVRNTTGYQYLMDIVVFGELVLSRPSYCGIMHTIDY